MPCIILLKIWINATSAVELKPKSSSETTVRMIAEILTYTTDYMNNYKELLHSLR